jgi:Flp pilus assembly protein TadB
MAQTKRKRQTKHRGNAAGVVESRGRTGRKPTAAEKSGNASEVARAKQKPIDKRDQPPTWRGAFTKALVATVLLLIVAVVILGSSPSTGLLLPFVLAMYTLISYYTDRWIYNRRHRSKTKRGGDGKAASR